MASRFDALGNRVSQSFQPVVADETFEHETAISKERGSLFAGDSLCWVFQYVGFKHRFLRVCGRAVGARAPNYIAP